MNAVAADDRTVLLYNECSDVVAIGSMILNKNHSWQLVFLYLR